MKVEHSSLSSDRESTAMDASGYLCDSELTPPGPSSASSRKNSFCDEDQCPQQQQWVGEDEEDEEPQGDDEHRVEHVLSSPELHHHREQSQQYQQQGGGGCGGGEHEEQHDEPSQPQGGDSNQPHQYPAQQDHHHHHCHHGHHHGHHRGERQHQHQHQHQQERPYQHHHDPHQHQHQREPRSGAQRSVLDHIGDVPVIPWDDLRDKTYLGKGSMCCCYTAKLGSQEVVVKVPRHDSKETMQEIERELEVEASLLFRLQGHPGIVRLYGRGTHDGDSFIVVEYLVNGTLEEYLAKALKCLKEQQKQQEEQQQQQRAAGGVTKRFSLPQLLLPWGSGNFSRSKAPHLPLSDVLQKAAELADILRFLHCGADQDIAYIYRDLKTQNIGLDDHLNIKLFDFGLAKAVWKGDTNPRGRYSLTGRTGTIRYMAPEVFNGKEYNTKVDVYGFAHIVHEMITLHRPYDSYDLDSYTHNVIDKQERPNLANLPKGLRRLLRRCWAVNPDRRPDFDAILEELGEMIQEEQSKEESDRQFSDAQLQAELEEAQAREAQQLVEQAGEVDTGHRRTHGSEPIVQRGRSSAMSTSPHARALRRRDLSGEGAAERARGGGSPGDRFTSFVSNLLHRRTSAAVTPEARGGSSGSGSGSAGSVGGKRGRRSRSSSFHVGRKSGGWTAYRLSPKRGSNNVSPISGVGYWGGGGSDAHPAEVVAADGVGGGHATDAVVPGHLAHAAVGGTAAVAAAGDDDDDSGGGGRRWRGGRTGGPTPMEMSETVPEKGKRQTVAPSRTKVSPQGLPEAADMGFDVSPTAATATAAVGTADQQGFDIRERHLTY